MRKNDGKNALQRYDSKIVRFSGSLNLADTEKKKSIKL